MFSDFLEDWIHDHTELIFILCYIILVMWILMYCCSCMRCNKQPCPYINYNYSDLHEWRDRYHIEGQNQSPIHIVSDCTRTINANNNQLLCFSQEHHHFPRKMRIINDGNHVLLCANWNGENRPLICGGPLDGEYKFDSIRFHWGSNNDEGSEHMLNLTRFAMEMQVSYCRCNSAGTNATETIAVISYFFKVTPTENPYLELIVQSLQCIKFPNESCNLRPFPLGLLTPIFNRRYFTYSGSLTYPPCGECVRWIIQPEPLTISNDQIKEFRKLIGYNGTILSNIRPVQCVNDRDIVFIK